MQKRVLGLSALFLVETTLVELHDSIAVPSRKDGVGLQLRSDDPLHPGVANQRGAQGPSRGNSARLSGCGWDRRQAVVRVAPFRAKLLGDLQCEESLFALDMARIRDAGATVDPPRVFNGI